MWLYEYQWKCDFAKPIHKIVVLLYFSRSCYVLCLLQGNIDAGTDFVIKESEDPIQTPNR
jgi:hypothetical protein